MSVTSECPEAEVPTPEIVADMELVLAASARGFKIAVPCRSCGRWLVAKESVRHQLGPTCRDRAGRRTEAA